MRWTGNTDERRNDGGGGGGWEKGEEKKNQENSSFSPFTFPSPLPLPPPPPPHPALPLRRRLSSRPSFPFDPRSVPGSPRMSSTLLVSVPAALVLSSGYSPGWFIEQIIVKNEVTGHIYRSVVHKTNCCAYNGRIISIPHRFRLVHAFLPRSRDVKEPLRT